MHSSTVITLLSAALTVASPLHHLHHEKRAIVTEWVQEVVVVTVTAGKDAPVFSEPPKKHQNIQTTQVVVVTQAAPPPAAVVAAPSPAPAPVKVEPVKVEPVKVEAPKVEAPKVEAPKVEEAPKAEEAPKPSTAVTQPTDYVTTATFNHNQHRQNHTAGDLAWNQTLADYAATIAKTCVFEHDMAQGTGNYGQNLAAYGVSSSVPDSKKALANAITEMWYYGEVTQFPFGVASPSTDNVPWLHFSQVAWKDTESVGCATQECAPGTVLGAKANYKSLYTVCNYFPAGNMRGSFDKQVTKSTGLVSALQAAI